MHIATKKGRRYYAGSIPDIGTKIWQKYVTSATTLTTENDGYTEFEILSYGDIRCLTSRQVVKSPPLKGGSVGSNPT